MLACAVFRAKVVNSCNDQAIQVAPDRGLIYWHREIGDLCHQDITCKALNCDICVGTCIFCCFMCFVKVDNQQLQQNNAIRNEILYLLL